MPQRISILPEIITNKIAAGEVVERPSSVIKELIENSLDAGANDITVEIVGGGRRRIRIIDNGHGMSREDALLSLERHATSKISSDSDLESIVTLGFRGEALPSIASVSRLTLATRESTCLEGTEITVEGGRVRDVKTCGMAAGTVLTVEHLFYNTPARLKFMKSADTEIGHVGDIMARMAVSRPDVAFLFVSDGRELIRVQQSDLRRRLSQVIGKDVTSQLFDVKSNNEHVTISGFISGPFAARSSAQSMYTYINGRFVRDKVVQHAIMQAYRGVIDRGRSPVVALFIKLLPGEVDVNVHPTKHEVRFRRQSNVHDFIQEAVSGVLRGSPWLAHQTDNQITVSALTGQSYRERIAAAAQASLSMQILPDYAQQSATAKVILREARPDPFVTLPAAANTVHEPATSFHPEQETGSASGYFSSLAIIGQFHREYILCQSSTELVIIDQHAASERVAFQRLKMQFKTGTVESQRLLFPEPVELSFSEVASAKRFRSDLTAIGFELDLFGGNTLIVAAVPRLAAEKKPILLVRDILADLTQLGASTAFDDVRDELLSRIACHAVMRGAQHLNNDQIAELLHSMDQTDFAASCPHGRPVSHATTLKELEKIFKRT